MEEITHVNFLLLLLDHVNMRLVTCAISIPLDALEGNCIECYNEPENRQQIQNLLPDSLREYPIVMIQPIDAVVAYALLQ